MSILWNLIGQLVISDWLLGGVYAELWADVSGMIVVWQIGTDRRFQVGLSTKHYVQFTGHPDYVTARFIFSVSLLCVYPWEFPAWGRRWCCVLICRGHRTASPPTAARRTDHFTTLNAEKKHRDLTAESWLSIARQIYNHFLKCVFNFSVPLFRAIHVLSHDQLMRPSVWCSLIFSTTGDVQLCIWHRDGWA